MELSMELNCNKIDGQSNDIHDYLSSFNKEIQDVNSVNNTVVEKLVDEELKKVKTSVVQDEALQKCMDGVTYFAAADGTLYSAAGADFKQQLAFFTAPEGVTGLQHILLAVGDVSSISNATATNLAIPLQLSTQVFATQGLKTEKLDDDEKVAEPSSDIVDDSSKIQVAKPTRKLSKPHQDDKACQVEALTNENSLTESGPISEQHLHTSSDLPQSETNQILVNTGDSYQAVTILPPGANTGELSYVLLLAPPKENSDDVKELTANEQSNEPSTDTNDEKVLKSIEEGPGFKTLTLRLAQKPTQILAQQHICNYCDYTSSKRYLLSRHLKSHSDDRPHKCTVCDRGFKTLASLNNHVNTHTGTRPHSCKACDSSFTTSGELVRHIRYKHTHEKPHHCNECDYASVELSKLKRHMRCHTGERPYQCPHCTYASPDTYKLKRHMRIHTGEKPYTCNICSARFTQSNSLKAHQMIHSGSKPVFQCEFCPTTCGRKTDLRIHIKKLHPNEIYIQCKDCDMAFQDQDDFVQHCKSHEEDSVQPFWFNLQALESAEQSFPCDQCEETFEDKASLRQHKSQCHNIGFKSSVEEDIKNNKTSKCSSSSSSSCSTCMHCNKTFSSDSHLLRHFEAYPDHKLNVSEVYEDESTDIETPIEACEDNEEKNSNPEVVLKVLNLAKGVFKQDCQLLNNDEEVLIVDDPSACGGDDDDDNGTDQSSPKYDDEEEDDVTLKSKEIDEEEEISNTKGDASQSVSIRCSPRTKRAAARKPVIRKTRSTRLARILPKTDNPKAEPASKLRKILPKRLLKAGRRKIEKEAKN